MSDIRPTNEFTADGPQTAPQSANPLILKLRSLSTLSTEDEAVLSRISRDPEVVGPNTDLIREGDAPDAVYLILEGIAFRYKRRASTARQIMAYLVPGDACDLDVAYLDAMDHSISTLSECKIVRIPLDTIREVLDSQKSVATAFRKAVLVDEATLREWLLNVGCRTAEERVAHLFCELLLRFQAVGKASGDSFAFPVSVADLGDTTGLSPVLVNRALNTLREKGLIRLNADQLRILDFAGLEQLAEFRPNYLHLNRRAVA